MTLIRYWQSYAEKWARDQGLQLNESLSLWDEGLSAYHQRHVKQGALDTFLRAIDKDVEMFYNPVHRHGSAGNLSPVEFERRYAQSGS